MGLLHEGRFLDVTIPFCVMIQNLLFVMKHPSETLRRQNLFQRYRVAGSGVICDICICAAIGIRCICGVLAASVVISEIFC